MTRAILEVQKLYVGSIIRPLGERAAQASSCTRRTQTQTRQDTPKDLCCLPSPGVRERARNVLRPSVQHRQNHLLGHRFPTRPTRLPCRSDFNDSFATLGLGRLACLRRRPEANETGMGSRKTSWVVAVSRVYQHRRLLEERRWFLLLPLDFRAPQSREPLCRNERTRRDLRPRVRTSCRDYLAFLGGYFPRELSFLRACRLRFKFFAGALADWKVPDGALLSPLLLGGFVFTTIGIWTRFYCCRYTVVQVNLYSLCCRGDGSWVFVIYTRSFQKSVRILRRF